MNMLAADQYCSLAQVSQASQLKDRNTGERGKADIIKRVKHGEFTTQKHLLIMNLGPGMPCGEIDNVKHVGYT